MSDTIECVRFQLNTGVSESDFLAANQEVCEWVRRQPGFRYRSLSRQENGLWCDIVYWASPEAAQAAATGFMNDLGTSAFMTMIAESSVNMSHSQVVSQQMGDCAAS